MNSSSPDSRPPAHILDRLTLRQRLTAGLSVGMFAMLAVALVAAAAVVFHARQEETLRRFNNDLSLVLQFSKAAGQMQLAASRYVYLGHASAQEQVQTLFQQWDEVRKRCVTEACLSAGKGAKFSKALRHLTTFHDTYLSVAESRDEIIASLTADFEQAHRQLLAGARLPDQDPRMTPAENPALVNIGNLLLAVEAQLFAFFHSMESDRLTAAEAHLDDMSRHFANLEQDAGPTASRLTRDDYEGILQIAYANIQRIRGYAYLVNVVMASEVYEMLYLTKASADLVVEHIDTLQADIERSRETFAKILLATIIAIALLALLVLRVVVRSITHQLQTVTDAFRHLATGGENPIEIQSYCDDEIGELVDAAKAFRDENVQVRQLLSDYEALNASLEAKVAKRTEELQAKNEELDLLASIDNLTGANNRRVLDTTLSRELTLAERYGGSVGAVLIDIDLFKTINDTYGHITGDKVLIALTTVVSDCLRSTDIFGRWGGEEFLVICPHTTLPDVRTVAEKIRETVAQARFIEGSPVTISAGVSVSVPGDSGETLVARADRALYEAKAAGRNCVKTNPGPKAILRPIQS